MEDQEIKSPIQFAAVVALAFGQVPLVFSFFYWCGFSAAAGIEVIQYFSLFELFASLPTSKFVDLLFFSFCQIVLGIAMFGYRARHMRFIDDPSIKVPPLEAKPEDLSTAAAERYMTCNEAAEFKQWLLLRRVFFWIGLAALTVNTNLAIWSWREGRPSEAINYFTGIMIASGLLLAFSNAVAFVDLRLRNTFSLVLLGCSIAAGMGSEDALRLLKDTARFTRVELVTEKYLIHGRLIFQTSSNALLYDPLRNFVLIPTRKILEIRYYPG